MFGGRPGPSVLIVVSFAWLGLGPALVSTILHWVVTAVAVRGVALLVLTVFSPPAYHEVGAEPNFTGVADRCAGFWHVALKCLLAFAMGSIRPHKKKKK